MKFMRVTARSLHPFPLPGHRLIHIYGTCSYHNERCYASKGFPIIPPALAELGTPSDMDAARRWIEAFQKTNIPREAVDLSFSRSSGPGGQNVNKVNTKCTTKCPLSVEWVPLWAKNVLRQNPAYVASSDSLLVTSTLHRSQAQNVDDCLSKLHSLIITASLSGIKKETSDEQKERVRGLEKAERARRRHDKEYKSKVKQTRKKGNWD